MNNKNGNNNSLFGKVSKTSSDSILNGMVKADNISDSDIEKNEQLDDYAFRKIIKDIKCNILHWGSVLTVIIMFAIVIAILALSLRYMYLVFDNPKEIKNLLATVITYILGILSTIAAKHFTHKK